MNHLISDFLIRIKNAYMAKKKNVEFPYSKVVLAIGKILEKEGYIKKITEKEQDKKKFLQVELLYKNRGNAKNAAFRDVKLVSKPSVHIYSGKTRIPKTRGGFGITVLSTSKGVMTDKQAVKEGVGGEILFQIF